MAKNLSSVLKFQSVQSKICIVCTVKIFYIDQLTNPRTNAYNLKCLIHGNKVVISSRIFEDKRCYVKICNQLQLKRLQPRLQLVTELQISCRYQL